jgi:hypothetical protein
MVLDNEVTKFEFEDKEYIIVKPSVNVVREAKFRYSKAFTSALKQGLYTRKKLESLLRTGDQDILKEHYETREENIRKALEIQLQISQESDPDKLEKLGFELQYLRRAMIQEDVYIDRLFSNTADQIAEEERMDYITSQVVCNKDGSRVWDSFSSMLEEERFEFIEHCKYQVMCWNYGLSTKDEVKEPEQEAFDKAKGIRESSIVTEVESENVEPKKKRGRKPKAPKED